MQDAPPADLPPEPPSAMAQDDQSGVVETPLSIEERDDGSLLINLRPLAPTPAEEECIESDPNPLDNGIIVCGKTETDQRLTSAYGPIDEPDDFGSAVPRARVKLSDTAEAEANVIKKGVGGWDADGAEVKVKIDF